MRRAIGILAAALVLSMSAAPAMALCPVGSYPATDSWGNDICRAFGSGGTVSAAPGLGGGCPNGSFPSMDSWGNKVCKEPGRGAGTYYDTSPGCPTGTHPWTDSWGNPACRSF